MKQGEGCYFIQQLRNMNRIIIHYHLLLSVNNDAGLFAIKL